MNIVTAIRNLPDEAESNRRSWLGRVWRWGWPIVVTGLGLYLLWQAYTNRSLSLAMIALTVTLYGATTLIGRIIELTPLRNETGYTIVYSLLGLGLLAIWVPPWYAWAPQLWPGMFTWDPTQAPTVFTIGGPLIIIGVILLVMFNARFLSSVIAAILGFIPSLRPVLKTAIAYPLSTRFRTGMTMVLFAMIMATVVVMAVILNTTQSLIRLDPRQTAGFDLRVSPTLLSFFSPIDNFAQAVANSDEALRSQVAAVGAITNQFVQAREAGAGTSYEGTGMTGVNDGYVSQARKIYHLQARAPGFADDAAVWDALASRDDTVIIKPSLLRPRTTVFGDMFADEGARTGGGGIDQESTNAGDGTANTGDEFGDNFGDGGPGEWRSTFRLDDLAMQGGQIPELYLELTTQGQDGVTRNHKVQVIGVLADEDNLAPAELIGSEAALTKLRSVPVTGDELFVKTVDGADPQEVAAKIEGTFVASGLNASVIADEYAQRQRLTGGALAAAAGLHGAGPAGRYCRAGCDLRALGDRAAAADRHAASAGFPEQHGGAGVRDRVELCLDHRAADRRANRHRARRQPGGGVLPAARSFDRGDPVGADRADRGGDLSVLAADDDPAGVAGVAHLPGRGAAVRVDRRGTRSGDVDRQTQVVRPGLGRLSRCRC